MRLPGGEASRKVLAYGGALASATIVLAVGRAFIRVALLHRAASAFFASAIWGALLLVSFAGWGAILNEALFPRSRADWGLRCAWGWAVTVAVGGVLCALNLATAAVLVTVTAMGLVAFAVDVVRSYRAWSRRNLWRSCLVASTRVWFACGVSAVAALALVAYFASIIDNDFNANDDTLCYFGFAREILERGTLTQPFSLRRLVGYGGTSVLNAFQLAIPVPANHLHLLDLGMALITVMALILGHRKASPRTSRAVILLLLLLTVTMPDIRANIAAAMTGVVFFLGLYRTLTWPPIRDRPGLRDAVPIGLLSAGACTLRHNYIATVGMWLALEFGAPMARSMRWRPLRISRDSVRRAAATAAATLLLLAPWCALQLRWCRTFLFPLWNGDYNRAYDYFKPLPFFEDLRSIWENFRYDLPVKAVPLFLIAALTTVDLGRYRTLAHFVIVAFVSILAVNEAHPGLTPHDIGRYYFGITFPALLAIALAVADGAGRGRTGLRLRADGAAGMPLVLAGIALQLYSDREQTTRQWSKYLASLQSEFLHPQRWTPPTPDPDYAQLQSAIPPGAPIAVMVDEFGRFDLRRNRIESLDMVGAVSPPPGLRLFESPDSVAAYLVAQGYRYAIVVHPDAANYLFRRDVWQHAEKADDTLAIWRRTARFYLRAFDVFDDLRARYVLLKETKTMTAIDLVRRQ